MVSRLRDFENVSRIVNVKPVPLTSGHAVLAYNRAHDVFGDATLADEGLLTLTGGHAIEDTLQEAYHTR